ncbi:hypothetical protein [Flavobacterium sp.]|uniref:hypothetical protein n=1 Tax=Flavobacterium sp. TaxID=239 RepID=UPI003751305D
MNYKFLVALFFLSFICNGQKSFEGIVKFKTEITITDSFNEDLKQNLQKKYGDSLLVYYSKNGNIKREYLNSKEFGNDIQIFNSDTGEMIFVKKNIEKILKVDMQQNTLKLLSKRKISNEIIMNLDCECFEYVALSKTNEKLIINYCYSSATPRIDYKLYEKYKDFFMDEYFQTTERPYLKYSMQTKKSKLTFIATNIEEKILDINEFQLK